MVLVETGIGKADFLDSTLKEVVAMLEEARDLKEQEVKGAWYRTRLQLWASLMPHKKKGSKLTPESVLPLPWDDEQQEQEQKTQEQLNAEYAAVAEAWKKIDKKKVIQRDVEQLG